MSKKETVILFPSRAGVGENAVTGYAFPVAIAEKMVKRGGWSYQMNAKSQKDVNLLLDSAQKELIERERLLNEREAELKRQLEEAAELRASLLSGGNTETIVKRGRKKAEV